MKRPLPRVEAYVWWCGDEYCDCTQPIIERIELHRGGPSVTRTNLWHGTFRSGESGATAELNRTAAAMRKRCHGLYEQIWWPWGRSSM